jgi:hypothetical protein
MAGTSTADFIRDQDIAAFKAIARMHGLYVVVRRTNPASLRYIGKEGYTPKLIDCKAKTAKHNVVYAGREYETAGLVIDCQVYEELLPDAFGAEKAGKARTEWDKFVATGKLAPASFYGPDGRPQVLYNAGYSYFTQRDPEHRHFG